MEDLNNLLVAFTGTIDDFMYTYILVILLVATGIWFTIRTRCVQIRYIKDMFTQPRAAKASRPIRSSPTASRTTSIRASCPRLRAPPTSTAARPMRTPRSPRSSVASRRSRRSWSRRPHALARATSSASRRRLRSVDPGAVFWMWLMAIIGAASAFVESTLAQIWKVRNPDGTFRGGPAILHSACSW